jgi:hypothetical protein
VLFLIQASGSMFEMPTTAAPYWGMVSDAISGPSSVAAPLQAKLPMGALFFYRETGVTGSMCPLTSSIPVTTNAVANLAVGFQTAAATYATAMKFKLDSPVAEAEASAVTALGAGTGAHIVLIMTGVPDTCGNLVDSPCSVDSVFKAVQNAYQAGVITHVVGLGDNTQFDELTGDTSGYETFLQMVANAGKGQNIKEFPAQLGACGGSQLATYSQTAGTARYYQGTTADTVASAIQGILTEICP